MATSTPYQAYQPPVYTGSTVGFDSQTNPVKLAQNQRAVVQSAGDQYQNTDQQLANQYAGQSSATQGYLDPLESNLAAGNGGYTSGEASQIQLTPAQQQNIVTGAGISAGVNTAASVGAAERAAAAAGGNPAALATYRARAAQTEGANAGNAMTQGRIAAQQAGSAGAQAVGNAQIAQQNQALGYYGNLQAQQNSASQNEQGLAQGAYGTQTQGTGAATNSALSAAGIPTTTDKVIGGIAGAAQGALSFLEDGTSGGTDAVLGENGPEVIVEHASDPDHAHTTFMDAGGVAPASTPSWLTSYLASTQPAAAPVAAPVSGSANWNKATPWSQLGQAIGGAAGKGLKASNNANSPGALAQKVQGTGWSGSSAMPPVGQMPAADPSLADPGAADLGLGAGDVAGLGGTFAADGVTGYRAKPTMLSNGMSAGFHWSSPRPAHSKTPPPGGYRTKDLLADGIAPVPGPPTVPSAPKLVTSPTRVHLDKGDAVVPLSYRPKAKVRPSAALAAMKPMRSMGSYGGVHA